MTKERRIFFSLLTVAILIFLQGAGFLGYQLFQKDNTSEQLITTSPTPVVLSQEIKQDLKIAIPDGLEKARVLKVIDGDTIEIERQRTVRFIGINTPETHHPRLGRECYGEVASRATTSLLEGKEVLLEKDVSDTDRYGRLLRYVYLEDFLVNEYLVLEGYALSSTYPPDVKYQDRFREAQVLAMSKERGLWKECLVSEDGEDILGYATDEYQPNVSVLPSTQTVTSLLSVKPAATLEPFVGSQPTQDTITRLPSATPQSSSIAIALATPAVSDVPASSSSCLIKGNISSGRKLYHLPGCSSYARTKISESDGERWFCSAEEAEKAGWVKAGTC